MIRCLTIDDSPLALDLLDDYIAKIPGLKLVARCNNAFDAIELIRKGRIDLIFLDIQMPDINGIELLKSVSQKPKVIFTTAFPNYAIEGFELDAVDYLLKPFTFARFKKAADKAIQLIRMENNPLPVSNTIFVKSGYETVRIQVHDITYIEALKDYIQIFTTSQKILSLMSMKEILALLPPGEFARVHRSYIVALRKITRVSARKVMIDSKEIPIGDNYKTAFQELLRERKLIS